MDRTAPQPPRAGLPTANPGDRQGSDRQPRRRHRDTSALRFHVGGAVLTALAAALAVVALFMVSFGTSRRCDGTGGDPGGLRLGILATGACLTAVPGLWARLGRRLGITSDAWWLLALGIAAATVATAATATVSDAPFCF